MRVYAPPSVYSALKPLLLAHPDLPMELHEAKPFEPIKADHLTFTPIVASHAPTQLCLNYIVQSGPHDRALHLRLGLYTARRQWTSSPGSDSMR